MTRRDMLAATGGALAASAAGRLAPAAAAEKDATPAEPFGYCLNTGTIRGQRLGIVREVETAAKAGYGAIEPWIGSLRRYQQRGRSLKDLRKRIADLGLKVPGAIGFARWLDDDDARRAKGLEQAKSDMDVVRQIGGTGIAAPPAGANHRADFNLFVAAERYRALLDIGEKMGVVPQLEIWGSGRFLHRLGQAAFIAVESGHRDACILPDVFHMYKGGGDFDGLRLLGPHAMRAFHLNDYPADPPRERISDAHRVYPGDGVAPLDTILSDLASIGFRGWLSLELFNRDYYRQPALTVAKTGLEKMEAAVRKALQAKPHSRAGERPSTRPA
jgi:2-keto-myo-inositol isomerase